MIFKHLIIIYKGNAIKIHFLQKLYHKLNRLYGVVHTVASKCPTYYHIKNFNFTCAIRNYFI